MALRINKINLSLFRSYDALRLDLAGAKCVVLTGANGSGKTNILEAISLLTPGRSLRGAGLDELTCRRAPIGEPWAVAAEITAITGDRVRIGTGLARDRRRRVFRIDGRDAASQSEASALIAAVWLTPQMDRLFLDGAGNRRRFLDRLVFALDPDHAGALLAHDRHLKERLALLQQGSADSRWLEQIEDRIAAHAVIIDTARRRLLDGLREGMSALAARRLSFPLPDFALTSVDPAVLRDKLRTNREADRHSRRTLSGVHRADFVLRYAAKDMPAAACSTGEQKGLLLATILAHAAVMQARRGYVPLLLLDEVTAHLDDDRKRELFSHLMSFDGQIFMTGTEESLFAPLRGAADFFTVSLGQALRRTI
jgi:DNA replication and repair protein RecF